jgi:predicted Zn-dependent protease
VQRGGAGRSAGAIALVGALACSINPLTGRRELALISEPEEVALGRALDADLIRSVGVYPEGPGGPVTAVVEQSGASLARASARPDLQWTFRVLDDPSVNAFAIPGGFVYVTRGLVAHLDSRAQLAAVLGHEIGHVDARHSINQLSRAAVAGSGVGLFRIFDPAGRHVGGAAERGLERFMLRHSREDEIEADDLGVRYLQREQIDPRAMLEVLETVQRAQEVAGGPRIAGGDSTHPDPLLRRSRLAATLGEPPAATCDEEWLAALEGLMFGPNVLEGFMVETRWVHPLHGVQVDLPSGWRVTHDRSSVAGLSPDGDALVFVTPSREDGPAAAHASFFAASGLSPGEPWRAQLDGFPVASSWFALAGERSAFVGIAAFVRTPVRTFELYALVTSARAEALGPALEAALASFARIRDPAVAGVQPMRIRIVRAPAATTLRALAATLPASVDVDTLARINQMDADEAVAAGQPLKWVRGGVSGDAGAVDAGPVAGTRVTRRALE